jgi:hypothetical protein
LDVTGAERGDQASISRADYSIFGADSEIGPDLAAVDWTATPLGSPVGWRLSLQTAVRILLSSRFSMWLGWGPDLTFFCNAAYRRDTLGRKYPWALGRPAPRRVARMAEKGCGGYDSDPGHSRGRG